MYTYNKFFFLRNNSTENFVHIFNIYRRILFLYFLMFYIDFDAGFVL